LKEQIENGGRCLENGDLRKGGRLLANLSSQLRMEMEGWTSASQQRGGWKTIKMEYVHPVKDPGEKPFICLEIGTNFSVLLPVS
jgi:hypothetical protein